MLESEVVYTVAIIWGILLLTHVLWTTIKDIKSGKDF